MGQGIEGAKALIPGNMSRRRAPVPSGKACALPLRSNHDTMHHLQHTTMPKVRCGSSLWLVTNAGMRDIAEGQPRQRPITD